MKFLNSTSLIKNIKILLSAILLLIIQSCVNSEIGKEIANSFDSPSDLEVETNDAKRSRKQPTIVENESKKKRQKRDMKTISSKTIIPSKRKEQPKEIRRKSIPFSPQPYRITIKLSATNPSAPAETVTKALRSAGVQFEVERIELIQNQSSENTTLLKRLKR